MLEDAYRKHKAVIIFSIVSSVVFIFLYASYWGAGRHVKKIYHTVLFPIQNSFNTASDKLGLRFQSISEISKLQEELLAVKTSLLEQKNVISELALVREEKRKRN